MRRCRRRNILRHRDSIGSNRVYWLLDCPRTSIVTGTEGGGAATINRAGTFL
jgi:hypothetical protein